MYATVLTSVYKVESVCVGPTKQAAFRTAMTLCGWLDLNWHEMHTKLMKEGYFEFGTWRVTVIEVAQTIVK